MSHIIVSRTLDADEKVLLMRQDARFDLTDADVVGADRLAKVRQAVRTERALPKIPKVFLSNDCVFNCAYCDCRQGNPCKPRYASTPRELAALAYAQAITERHGIFITSAIHRTPDYTQELILETLRILRVEMGYQGYLHAKVMPGADTELIRRCGAHANRLSVNIEVAHSTGYARIARNKTKGNILTPMEQISRLIRQGREERSMNAPPFATTQTTQLMAGSLGEDDYTILRLSGALYHKFRLSRVYYTAFHYQHQAEGYQLPQIDTPPWRMARLYQADRLMQQYGFTAEEIAPEGDRFLGQGMDPKTRWALRNLRLFPVEINRVEESMLLRVPGIGPTYARRIVQARREGILRHDSLRALGIPLRRCRHFITCDGRYDGLTCENEARLFPLLADPPEQIAMAL